MSTNIQITDNVFKRIVSLRQKANNLRLHLRIAVSGGGCSGFIYNYSMVEDCNSDDLSISKEDVNVLIDPASQAFLENSIVDFIEELGSSYFSIKNPLATTKCGCGNSFGI